MTREEAIKIIDCYDINFYDLSGEKIPAYKLAEAFDMAIEALSTDAVHKPDYSYEAGMVRRLKEALSADAVSRCEVVISKEKLKEVLDVDKIVERIKEEYDIGRPHGEWIITKEGEYDGRAVHKTECSICGHETFYKANKAHYCPNCGARMYKGGEDITGESL